MEDAMRRFGRELRSGDVGLLYFAGHGMQIDGENYLIPIDAVMENAADVKYKTVRMHWVLDTMREAQNGFNVIIFDACRNNPFSQGQRAGLRGLAMIPKVRGSLVAYSTSPEDVAEDGHGRKQVRIAVEQETGGRQTPWELSSLVGDFYFAGR
jgi:uncharacterized caspase-like protein